MSPQAAQATSEEAEAEEDSDVAVAALRSALEASQEELFDVLQQVPHGYPVRRCQVYSRC